MNVHLVFLGLLVAVLITLNSTRNYDSRINESFYTIEDLPYFYGREVFVIFHKNKLRKFSNLILLLNYYYYNGKMLSSSRLERTSLSKKEKLIIRNYNIDEINVFPKNFFIYQLLMFFEHIYRLPEDKAIQLLDSLRFIDSIHDNLPSILKIEMMNQSDPSIKKPLTFFSRVTDTELISPLVSIGYSFNIVNIFNKFSLLKYVINYHGKNVSEVNRQRQIIQKGSNQLIYDENFFTKTFPTDDVSFLMHRIWLTDTGDPKDIPEDYITDFKNTYHILESSYYPWKFIIWCNLSTLSSLDSLKELYPRIDIRNIEFFEEPFYGREIFNLMMDNKIYSMASDVLRYNIIYRYGGIYMDMGINLTRDISNLFLESERIFYKRNGNIDICIQSCKFPLSDKLYLKLLTFLENKSWKQYNYGVFKKSQDQNFFTATEYLQYVLDTEFYTTNTLLLNNGFCVNRKHMNSWHYAWKNKNDINIWTI